MKYVVNETRSMKKHGRRFAPRRLLAMLAVLALLFNMNMPLLTVSAFASETEEASRCSAA